MAEKDPKKEALETASIISDALSSIAAQVSDIFANALAGTDRVAQTVTKDIQKRFNDMAKVTDDIATNALKLKEGLIKTDTVEKQILNRKIKQEALGSQLVTLLKQQGVEAGNIEDLIEGQNNGTIKLTRSQKALVNEYVKSKGFNDEYISQLQEQLEGAEKIEKTVGVTGKILKGFTKIPIVGQFIDAEKAVDAANKAAAEGAGKLGAMGAALGSIGKSLLTSLTDPLTIITGLISIIKDLDDGAEKYARSMNITYEEALKVRNEMEAVAGVTKTQMLEASIAINKELGTSTQLTKENAAAFAKLQTYAGMTSEELMGITSLSLTNGKNLKQNTNEFIAQAKHIAAGKKIVLNEKQLMADIGKISAATTLSLGKNPKELAKAAATAKSLGIEMSKLEDIAGGLLDFESSIENELSAELLTGKNLNLEKARSLALNNDIAGMAEEINNQIGTSADYTNMNRIQQEALAKAVGMNREELAQTLYTQEQLRGLTGEEAKKRQSLLDQRIEEVGLAQAQKEIEEGGFEALEKQAGIQTTFNQQMLELKDILANSILPIFVSIGTFLTEHMGIVKTLIGLYVAMKGIMLATNIIQSVGILLTKKKKAEEVKDAGASIIGNAFKMAGGLGPLGIAIVAGLIGAGIGALAMYTADDMMSPAPGGSGYGKRTLFGPEGAIQLNNKDTVIAGTNLFGDDVKSEPGKSTQMGNQGTLKIKSDGGDMSAVVNAIIELRRDVNVLASRPINVSIDGKKVIEATTGNESNTVGDESRKNSYRVS